MADRSDFFSRPIHVTKTSKKGDDYYEAALHAVWQEDYDDAKALFKEAVSCYRADGMVYALARLRVNELIANYLGEPSEKEKEQLAEEILEKATRISVIESLEPPFAQLPVDKALAQIGLKIPKAAHQRACQPQ
ncbi:MAG: hypothetical protein QME66_03430 [Candidatus Eisenbacteria bacterium]|nr:hypothetical protein [Candidatus Eisenbacteria bacterium]